ncbi:regulatory protein GemA [Glaesserella parasuis]|nr:regulatory protein GemA [Glaesserella parasuis]MCT8838255.1 regulatory protein GemA [Glaesserella parasuis]MCT8839929.1 regulatory protein GemA [Glaesserella parasuis]
MRNKLLQLVHIGKNQLGMDDETYRSLLSQQFYQNSAKNISYSELVKLVKILQEKGAKIRLPKAEKLSPIQRKLWAVWKQMAKDGTVTEDSSRALDSFAQRYFPTVKHWKDLSATDTASLLETLKQWKKRVGN